MVEAGEILSVCLSVCLSVLHLNLWTFLASCLSGGFCVHTKSYAGYQSGSCCTYGSIYL